MSPSSEQFQKRQAKSTSTTAARPYPIENPTIGFLNIQGDRADTFVASDKRVLSSQFHSSRVSSTSAPHCQVLFIYCTIDAQGRVVGSSATLRQIIKEAGALVAVIATVNESEHYIKAIAGKNDWTANIVLTTDRKGDKFSMFFKELFKKMSAGTSMLLAWVELAPQIPGIDHPNIPSTIMAAEAGHLTFIERP